MEDIIDFHLNVNLGTFFSNIINAENFDIYYSDVIEDQYWNYAYLKKGDIDLENTIKEIILKMEQINRKPVIYITSNIMNEKLEYDINRLKLNLLSTDCWMSLENLNEFKTYKSNFDFSIYKVDKELQNTFIKAVMDGFSGDDPDDPYGKLPEGYRISYKKIFQKKWEDDIKIINYIGMKSDKTVGTATVVNNKSKALIYNITTLKEYKRKGVCKQIMSNMINELNNLNIKEVWLQTEKGYYPEEVYRKIGFKEKFLGKAYALL